MALALVTTFSLSACGGNEDSGGGDEGSGGKYALLMSHMTNEFVTTVSNGAKEEAEKQGVELEVFDGEQDAATQISQIESCVTQGFDGIIVEPISVDGLKQGLTAAEDAGIPLITVVQQVTTQDELPAYVGGNEPAAAELEMQKIVDKLGGKGDIAILWGPMGSDAQIARKEGYDKVLKANSGINLVFDKTANWTTDEAQSTTENWLQTGKNIDAVVAQNDGMAVGAIKAIQDAKKDILVAGIDATADGIAAIEAGTMFGTVSQRAAEMGSISVDTIIKVAKGETVEKIIYTEAEWVDSANVADFK
jgi:ribose transport system substrate-binding protein/inositol transport system substrate-binding protein